MVGVIRDMVAAVYYAHYTLRSSRPPDPAAGRSEDKLRPGSFTSQDEIPACAGMSGKFMHALAVESHLQKFNPERVVFNKTYIWCIVFPAHPGGCIVLLGGENNLVAG